jgi:hypothetical protein
MAKIERTGVALLIELIMVTTQISTSFGQILEGASLGARASTHDDLAISVAKWSGLPVISLSLGYDQVVISLLEIQNPVM